MRKKDILGIIEPGFQGSWGGSCSIVEYKLPEDKTSGIFPILREPGWSVSKPCKEVRYADAANLKKQKGDRRG
nr:hypothetical protein [uncultured Acetatifactor sp.]